MGAPLEDLGFHHARKAFSGRELFQVALRLPQFDHVSLEAMMAVFERFAPVSLGCPPINWNTAIWRPYSVEDLRYLSSWTGLCCIFCGGIFRPNGPKKIAPNSQHRTRDRWLKSQWAYPVFRGTDVSFRLLEHAGAYKRDLARELSMFTPWALNAQQEPFRARSLLLAQDHWADCPFENELGDLSRSSLYLLHPWCGDCHQDLWVPLGVPGTKQLRWERDRDPLHLARLQRMLGKRSYRERATRHFGFAIRATEAAERRDDYQVAQFDIWDPKERAKAHRQRDVLARAEAAASEAYHRTFLAALEEAA